MTSVEVGNERSRDLPVRWFLVGQVGAYLPPGSPRSLGERRQLRTAHLAVFGQHPLNQPSRTSVETLGISPHGAGNWLAVKVHVVTSHLPSDRPIRPSLDGLFEGWGIEPCQAPCLDKVEQLVEFHLVH